MISRTDREKMAAFVEKTKSEKMANIKEDLRQPTLVRGNKNQQPPKGWPK